MSSVVQKMLKSINRESFKQFSPCTSGMIPSGPGLFPNLVFVRALSNSCISIGLSIDPIIACYLISDAEIDVRWLVE